MEGTVDFCSCLNFHSLGKLKYLIFMVVYFCLWIIFSKTAKQLMDTIINGFTPAIFAFYHLIILTVHPANTQYWDNVISESEVKIRTLHWCCCVSVTLLCVCWESFASHFIEGWKGVKGEHCKLIPVIYKTRLTLPRAQTGRGSGLFWGFTNNP